jgi:hypothetical protein
MAYASITKPSLYFNSKLYTGNGGTQSITGIGFQPDMNWIKLRSTSSNHMNQDAVRGSTKHLHANTNDSEVTDVNGVTSFDTDGFSVGSNGNVNNNNSTIVSWNWKAGTTGSGSTTGSGTSKTYNYSVNTTSRFSITKYAGNGNSGHTIPHSLGTTPTLIMVKELNGNDYWRVYHPALTTNYNLYLNTTHAQDSAGDGYVTNVGSTTFGFGGSSNTNTVNQDGLDYIAYCFADVTGYSKFGSYKGNGNADGAFVYTGFKPAFVIVKRTNSTGNWQLLDTKRLGYNVENRTIYPNSDIAEQDEDDADILSNGFKLRGTGTDVNGNGDTYIFMAFAEEPLVVNLTPNGIPATAR